MVLDVSINKAVVVVVVVVNDVRESVVIIKVKSIMFDMYCLKDLSVKVSMKV